MGKKITLFTFLHREGQGCLFLWRPKTSLCSIKTFEQKHEVDFVMIFLYQLIFTLSSSHLCISVLHSEIIFATNKRENNVINTISSQKTDIVYLNILLFFFLYLKILGKKTLNEWFRNIGLGNGENTNEIKRLGELI